MRKDKIVQRDTSIGDVVFQPQVYIDLCYQTDGLAVFSGWFTYQTNFPVFEMCSDESGEPLNQHWIPVDRQDVVHALGLDDSVRCTGFIWIGDRRGITFEHLRLTFGHTQLLISSFSPSVANDIDTVFESLGEFKARFIEKSTELGILIKSRDKETYDLAISHLSNVEHFFDHCFFTDDRLLYFKGWFLYAIPFSVKVIDSSGNNLNVTETFICYRRQDILNKFHIHDAEIDAGFIGICRLPINFKPVAVSITFSDARVISREVDNGEGKITKLQALKEVLETVNVHKADFFQRGYAPILNLLNEIWQGDQLMDKLEPLEHTFGVVNTNPTVSVIIPIYGRYDFLQHQLLNFSQDADFCDYEIIYVLDDPRIVREFNIACHGVYNTFQHPFKTIYAGRNLGFAGANNLGATIANGRYILALNSDVLPSDNGWLGRLVNKFESLESAGILGSKLIYEDNTIQHIGMKFQRDAYYPGVWMNYHPFKGMPSHLVSSEKTAKVESVTGACMLMEKSFYLEIGGFDTRYILGDFEDSDLCLKVYLNNKWIYLDTEESLFHLERLSQNLVDSGDWKYKLTLLNGLYQREKWGSAIEEVIQKHV